MEELSPEFFLPKSPYDMLGNLAQPNRSTLAEFLELHEKFGEIIQLDSPVVVLELEFSHFRLELGYCPQRHGVLVNALR